MFSKHIKATHLRRLALLSQGLTSKQAFGTKLSGTHKAIEHLAYVQVDTLSVVERAHHHILWSRVPGYEPAYLNKLVKKKLIFEYWYHAASYLPMRDYRFAQLNMISIRNGENRYYNKVDEKLMKQILERVSEEGPLRLRDFDQENKSKGAWWNQSAGRRAFEKLFMQGDLMVCERNGMEKVYDLAEHCLPDDIDHTIPTISEYAAHLFDNTLRAHGVFTWKQLLHLKTGKAMRNAMQEVLNDRIESGQVCAVDHEDMPNTFVDIKAYEKIVQNRPVLKVLSPFDNAAIHRERLKSLFGFDYKIECYVTAAKREFGYFCLSVLYADQFVGRIDCKAHRAEHRLQVISFHLEDKKLDQSRFLPALMDELHRFAEFNQCKELDSQVLDNRADF